MIYELRTYRLRPGRLPDAMGRFNRLPPLFRANGIRNLGRWRSLTASAGPSVTYIMAYNDFAERDAQWGRFYIDPDWHALRAESNGSEEMIERFDMLLLKPAPIWMADEQAAERSIGGVHELRLFRVGIGQTPRAHRFLDQVLLPAIASMGGQVMLVADVVSGNQLPAIATITAWAGVDAWLEASAAMDEDDEIRAQWQSHRAEQGGEALGAWRRDLLVPFPDPLPRAALTLNISERAAPPA